MLPQQQISVVDHMPDLPQPLILTDWQQRAHDFDALAFDFQAEGLHLPLPWWNDSSPHCQKTTFALPAYVGATEQTSDSNQYEIIPCLGTILGATLAGIDKSRQGDKNWVGMLSCFFHESDGIGLYLNNIDGKTGYTFWYELLPSILFYQIFDHYPDTPNMQASFLLTAERWREASLAMQGDYNHTAFDFATGTPFDNGLWKEGDAAAAIGWIEYMAYIQTGERKFQKTARDAMDFLEETEVNPYYECLLPFGAYVATRMNAELDTEYDADKLIQWSFDGSNPRRWGVTSGRWGAVDCSGLVGSVLEKEKYAFAMNTFVSAGALAPIARYNPRYAAAMGKWLLNLSVNARYFYPDAWAEDQQSGYSWYQSHMPTACISYEGLREQGRKRNHAVGDLDRGWTLSLPDAEFHVIMVEGSFTKHPAAPVHFDYAFNAQGPWEPAFEFNHQEQHHAWMKLPHTANTFYLRTRNASDGFSIRSVMADSHLHQKPYAMGDPIMYGWGETDFALYGGAFVGILAALIEATDVPGILKIDCRATESFASSSFPSYLLYNPYPEERTVSFDPGDQAVKLYEAVSGRFLFNPHALTIPGKSAILVVVCPAGGQITHREQKTLCDGITIDYQR